MIKRPHITDILCSLIVVIATIIGIAHWLLTSFELIQLGLISIVGVGLLISVLKGQ